MRVVAMLPTYNEAGNIRQCTELILSLPVDAGVMIVDDGSPDGTGQIADELAVQYPGRVIPLHRTGQRGRGLAGIEGFARCVELPVEYVIELDADLQHDPLDITRLVAAADRSGADIVVGSRYVAGGGEVDRNPVRRMISRVATAYLRLALGVSLRDCTSGYRLFRRESLRSLDISTMSASGPWILQEVLWRARAKHLRIIEIPILFHNRETGESKLNLQILLRSIMNPFMMRRVSGAGVGVRGQTA